MGISYEISQFVICSRKEQYFHFCFSGADVSDIVQARLSVLHQKIIYLLFDAG